jgi:hypothetical protein
LTQQEFTPVGANFFVSPIVVVNFMSYDINFIYVALCHIRLAKPFSAILRLLYPEEVISPFTAGGSLFVSPNHHLYSSACESHVFPAEKGTLIGRREKKYE